MIRVLLVAASLAFVFTPTIDAADNVDHRELLAKHYRLEKPNGAGPFPAVILVSGGSGFDADFAKGHYDAVQTRLVELGFVTLRVNYLAARNVSASTFVVPVSPEQVASDICIAVGYLRQQPFVKKGAINVMGWSFGASGALQSLGRSPSRDPVQADAVVAYYPECSLIQQKWDSQVPILVLVGMVDNITPLRKCNWLFRGIPEDRLTIREYDDAHHGFDMSGLPSETQYQWGTIGYNETAAKSAWLEVTNFLRK
jgi:dienelactone hydrolase